jgi:hypothetical protein
MLDIEFTSLALTNYQGLPLPNRYYRQKGAATGLAVMLPGLHYNSDMPLLYYPARLLLQHGYDVVQIQPDYTRPAFQGASEAEQNAWLRVDARTAVKTGRGRRPDGRLVLLGKSIGTLGVAQLVDSEFTADAYYIWLTPLLQRSGLVSAAKQCKGVSLFVVGSADPTYDPGVMEDICETTGAKLLLLQDANHLLEVPEDIQRSLRLMDQLLTGIEAFIA